MVDNYSISKNWWLSNGVEYETILAKLALELIPYLLQIWKTLKNNDSRMRNHVKRFLQQIQIVNLNGIIAVCKVEHLPLVYQLEGRTMLRRFKSLEVHLYPMLASIIAMDVIRSTLLYHIESNRNQCYLYKYLNLIGLPVFSFIYYL